MNRVYRVTAVAVFAALMQLGLESIIAFSSITAPASSAFAYWSDRGGRAMLALAVSVCTAAGGTE